MAVIFFLLILIFGYYSFNNMPIERVPNPEEGIPTLYVSYYWTGASPDMILQKVLVPVEGEITQIKGVEKLNSRAAQNQGTIRIEFNRDARMNFAEVELRERLNRLQRELPPQVRNPYIQPWVPEEFSQQPLFRIGLYGKNYSVYTIRQIAEKEIIPQLKSIPGIERVILRGGVEPEIKIRTNLERLKRYEVNLQELQTTLSRYFYTKHSLTVKDAGEISLSLTENPEKIKDIQDVVIKSLGEKKVLLKDVADVVMGYQRLTEESRFQGKPFVQVEIIKEPKTSHLEMSKRVKTKMHFLVNRLRDPIEFVIQSDDSKELEKQLLSLGKISILILIIVFLILYVIIRDIKASLLIFSSVFFSVFATFTVVYLFKIPLNMLTLSGLSLGFGMFVDNAVVVFDSILRFREYGHSRKEAAEMGPKAVIMPVLASTLTTIIVFFSFAIFFKDRLRIYYLPLAYVIAIALLSSMAVAFVSIPSLSARLRIKLTRTADEEGLFNRGRFFPFVLKYPLVILLPILITLTASYITFKKEVSFGNFFGWMNQQRVIAYLRFPLGAEFEDVKKTILEFEKVALSKPCKKEVNTLISGNIAYMTVEFPPEVEATAQPVQLKQELVGLATNLAGVGVQVAGFDQEPYFYSPDFGSNLPFDIRITGYNYEKLMEFTGEIKKTLLRHKRIKEAEVQTDLQYWWQGREKYYSFQLNRDKLRLYKIPPFYIDYLIRTMLREGAQNQYLKFDDRELSVEIKASDVDTLEMEDILNKYYYSPYGAPFRLRDVVDIKFTSQKGGITRENQEYQAMVQWDYLGSAKTSDRFHKALYDRLSVPPGFKKSLERQTFRLTQEEEDQLNWAIILSCLLIYLILAVLYEDFLQPLLIMLAIPLALIGVFLAYWIANYAFDSTGYIGVILLSGIVVNNAIILVDNINRHLEHTKQIIHSIVIGTKERVRPILMTTLTTILGMLPLVIFKEEGSSSSDIWSSLALCTVGGLTTSTILILLVIPIFYYYLYKFQKHILQQDKPESEPTPVS